MNRLWLATVPVVVGTACFLGGVGDNPDSGPTPDASVMPFQADTPFTYVSKVKNLLTGLAATQKEIDSVVQAGAPGSDAQQAALVALIDQWMALPEYTTKMLTFFELAFQQTQLTQVDFNDIVPNGNGSIGNFAYTNQLIENVKESFARTALDIVAKGQPFTNVFTTTSFMMTPALAELYAFMDWNQVSDTETVVDHFAQYDDPKGGVTVQDTTPIPYDQTIDPTNANFMNWYYPGLSTVQPPSQANPAPYCQVHTRNWVSTNFNNRASAHLVHYLLYGGFEAYRFSNTPGSAGNCSARPTGPVTNPASIMTASDFDTWTLVNVRKPNGSESITPFWNMKTIRQANELVLKVPRVGFFSTPAFHANWQTNTSNQMRVTINQALIVALGKQVDGTDPTQVPANPPGLAADHVSAGQACLGCHQTLDPTRSILMANYTSGYGIQTDASIPTSTFYFQQQIVPVHDLGDFGAALATHPLLADGWVQKLCYYATSNACTTSDPEYIRIRDDFKNGFSWKKLIEDVFSSPIVTYAKATATTQAIGQEVSVSRSTHLCRLLDARLHLTDTCGLDSIVPLASQTTIEQISGGFPSDGYGRGAAVPVLPAMPTLFYRSGLENVCTTVAGIVIDNASPPPGATTYSSSNAKPAIADFVATLMGVPADDARSAWLVQTLTQHFDDAQADAGASASDALKSTFVTACLTPNVTGIGM